MESKTKSYIAFFDIDRTILSVNSGSVLVREAYKRGLISTSGLLNAIFLSLLFKFHLMNTFLIISRMGKWLRGLKVEDVEVISQQIVNKYLLDAIRPEIYSEIRFHKENNAEVVILSSSIPEICRPLYSHLGFDNFICTVMELADGIFTGRPETTFCFEDEKRVRLKEYCRTGNYNTREAFYYGDSISDLPALEVVGHPVCVSPDKKLKRIALARGWRICDW